MKIKTLYQDLESLAIVGYNESYEAYMIEAKKAVSNNTTMTTEQKKIKITAINVALNLFQGFRKTIGF
jgi:hypothetical protein